MQLISFQCSPLATADGILKTFNQASSFQKSKDLEKFVSVVVLDEVGLAEDSPRMPLKVKYILQYFVRLFAILNFLQAWYNNCWKYIFIKKCRNTVYLIDNLLTFHKKMYKSCKFVMSWTIGFFGAKKFEGKIAACFFFCHHTVISFSFRLYIPC